MRRTSPIAVFCFYVASCSGIIYLYLRTQEEANMSENVLSAISVITAITGLIGFIAVVVQQIFFYRKDSRMMDRIDSGVSQGTKDVQNQMKDEHQDIKNTIIGQNQRIYDATADSSHRIEDKISQINQLIYSEISSEKMKYEYLQGNESLIKQYVDGLGVFAEIMADNKVQYTKLQERCRYLEKEIEKRDKELEQYKSRGEKPRSNQIKNPDIEQEIDIEP